MTKQDRSSFLSAGLVRGFALACVLSVGSLSAFADGRIPEGKELRNLMKRISLASQYAADSEFKRDFLELHHAKKVIIDDEFLSAKLGFVYQGSKNANQGGGAGRIALSILSPVKVELGPSLVSPFFSPKFGDATLYISSQAVEPMEKKIELAVAGIQKTIKSIENLALRLNSEKDEKKREELQRRLSLKRQGLFKQQVTLKAEQLASVTALVHEMNHIREGYAIRMASSQAEFEHRAYSLERDMLLRLGIALKKQHPDPAKRAVIDAVIQETIENEIESSMEQAQVRPNWKG